MIATQRQALVAVLLVIASGVLFVIMNAMVKAMIVTLEPMVVIWGRYFFHVAFVVVVFPKAIMGVFRTGQVAVQIGRSALLLGSTIANFLALALMSLADVAAIIFTAPILVALLAVLMLKERVAAWRWVLIGLGFSGALIIVQPGGDSFGLGALLAFGCTVCYALYQITTRIVREAEPIVSLLYGGLVGVVVISLVVPLFWQTPTATEWLLLVVIGSLGAGGHLLVILALQRAEASKVAPFTYVQLVWAMLASLVVFGDVPGLATLIGATVIVTSGLLLYRLDLREAAVQRQLETREEATR
jgi:drug/metabolite transporter (DMT)-like permease